MHQQATTLHPLIRMTGVPYRKKSIQALRVGGPTNKIK
jgi:hypothetical protein